jgi:hypothetical protein
MGLEPLTSRTNRKMAMHVEDVSSPPSTAALHAQGSQGVEKKKTLSILDLPLETQKDIFKHVSTFCSRILNALDGEFNSDYGIYNRPPQPISLPSPSFQNTSEILLLSNCIEVSISSSQMTMILQMIPP